MNASSEAEVKQSGKKLEVYLKTGKLYLNVTVPIADDGRLNIRTSTMITGIRSTSGWVQVVNNFMSRIYVLTGTVVIYTTDPLTGLSKFETIHAGEVSISYVRMESGPEYADIIVERFSDSDGPVFLRWSLKRTVSLRRKSEAKPVFLLRRLW